MKLTPRGVTVFSWAGPFLLIGVMWLASYLASAT